MIMTLPETLFGILLTRMGFTDGLVNIKYLGVILQLKARNDLKAVVISLITYLMKPNTKQCFKACS